MRRIGAVWCGGALVMSWGTAAVAVTDDFADGVAGSAWSVLQDDPATLSLNEQGGRLDVLANNPANNAIDALYLSNGNEGFRLGTTQDFELTLGYALNGFDATSAVVGDLLGLTFGVGRDLEGQDSAAIGFGVGRQAFGPIALTSTALAAGFRIDDTQTESVLAIGSSATGTFRIAYDAAGDDLSLGVADGPTFLLEDTVRGVWQAEGLYVSFGARGGGFSWGPGDAWLDDFALVRGQVLPLNQASTLAGDFNDNGSVEQADLDLVLGNWGASTTPATFLANIDGLSDGVDQDELDAVLSNWGSSTAPTFNGVAVPEPATAAAALLLALAFGTRNRQSDR